MTSCLELSSVVKTFSAPSVGRGRGPTSEIRAVDGIDLEVSTGEIVALLGPNGAGKTTTLDMVLGFTAPTAGTVAVFGGPPTQAIRAGRVAAVLQTGGLLRDITVRETVTLFASMHDQPRAVEDVLSVAGLDQLATQKVQKCSGGEQQRLRFAVALLGNPDLLILDEPTAGMDVEARRDFWKAMRAEASDGRTIIFATHYLQEAEDFAPRTVLLDRGRVVADAPTSDIRANGVQRRVSARYNPEHVEPARAHLAALESVSKVEVHAERISVMTNDSDEVAVIVLQSLHGWDLEIQHESLEDAFVSLTSTATEPAGATS